MLKNVERDKNRDKVIIFYKNHHIYIEIYKEIQPNTYSEIPKEVEAITKI